MLQTRGFVHDFIFFLVPRDPGLLLPMLGDQIGSEIFSIKYEYCAREIFKACLHSGSLLNDPFLVFPSTLSSGSRDD